MITGMVFGRGLPGVIFCVQVMDGEGDMNDEVEDDEEYMPSGVNFDDEEDDEEEEDAQMKDMDEGLQIQYEEFADEFAKISLEIAKAAELQAAEGRRTVLVRYPMCAGAALLVTGHGGVRRAMLRGAIVLRAGAGWC